MVGYTAIDAGEGMMETTRDRQIDYINETMGNHRPGFDVITELQQMRYDGLLKNLDALLTDICERMEDDNEDNFFDTWKDECYDYIISTIDWDALTECKQCSKYYEWGDSDASYIEQFCSEDCEDVYEECPDRRDR
jgi:hypothetical protein